VNTQTQLPEIEGRFAFHCPVLQHEDKGMM
jgi:FtsP/CotA-like multicopper oxidase with cupredoxin domain